MGCANRNVHVGADGPAVSLAASESVLACLDDFGPREMILECPEFRLGLRRVADDATIIRDERHAAGHDLAQPIGFDRDSIRRASSLASRSAMR